MSIAAKTAALDGLPLHYLECGAGKPVLYLHGAGGAPPQGADFVARLGARHRLLLPSRPGFDATPIGSCRGAPDVAAVMAAFIDRVADGKAHVVAQSAGAAIGCWLAILHPAKVESLVLSAPAAFARPHRPPAPEDLARILYGDAPAWSAPPSPEERARIAKNAEANMRRFPPGESAPLLDRLGEIAAPTLLLWGTGDRLLPEEAALPYQQRIPNCTRIMLYGAAHEMPIAACAPWVRLVADFVERGERFVVNLGEG